jgi:alkylation response protein AidB-like acyl-CoA dehydrogenase
VAPRWPVPWGHAASIEESIEVEVALLDAGIRLPDNPIGIGWAGPTILAAGTGAQKERFLSGILSDDDHWCQLFSEPDAGSDLASLRTSAVRDGDEWVVDGQKIWTTDADRSAFGILLARTDPDVSSHRGISYFLCAMDTPGIEVRPIREMTGGAHFCEVFLTGARLPGDALLGDEGEGWRLATLTLGNERVSLSHGGLLWGMGPTGAEVLAAVAATGRAGSLEDPRIRQRYAQLWTEAFVLERLGERVRAGAERDGRPGPEASLEKLLSDQHGQRLFELVFDVAGPAGLLAGGSSSWPESVAQVAEEPLGAGLGAHHQHAWPWGALFSRALTIGGGTTQVQRNIIAERLLGLPREPR